MTGPFRMRALLDGVADLDTAALPAGVVLDDVEVAEVRDDSRKVQPGDLFVAVPGSQVDGRRFIADAAARGARVLVTEGPPPPATFPGLVVQVGSARRALGVIAGNRFGAARALDLIAVTGTNGKTTTTFLLEAILLAAGRSAGVIGTVSNRASGWPGGARPASLTTPGALEINALFAEMRAVATTDVVLEATSQALEQGRLEACRFLVAGLTNVTQDHLDYHGSMERYFDAKAILFERLMRADGVGVFFVDQDEGRRMRARTRGRTLGVALTPGGGPRAAGAAEVVVTSAAQTPEGWRLQLATPLGPIELVSPLVGDFNLSNLALAVGMAVAHGLDREAIVGGLARLAGVPGRLQRVPNPRGVLCLVDYSHTPDALERAIAAVRPLTAGRVVVVFGCGGDRDRGKRPLMGEIVARDADLAIVTSDNPRTEEPGSILDMIIEGVRRQGTPELDAPALAGAARGYHREVDRRAAIRRAAAACRAGDVLLIAGKGHEDYQILGTTKVHFDDREEASAALAAVTASGANP